MLQGDESESTMMVRGVKRCELSLVEPYIWIERSDEMAASGALSTQMRRRAESKTGVRD
jgi:hypothetical protein